jgi:hypothetical protein
MSDWLPTILNSLAVLGGIVLIHSIFLYSQFYRDSQGYMWRAVRKIWFFLLMFFIIEWAIGALFFYLSLGLPRYVSVPVLLLAAIIGIVVAAFPIVLEGIFLPKSSSTVETLERPLTRLLLKLDIVLRYNFAWAIEYSKEQDLFDCQQPHGGDLNVEPVDVGRRIRKLYEFCKYKIAEERNDYTLLRYDVGRTPWDQFYLLTRHLGRDRLRKYIKHPIPSHFPNWNGSERRRIVGNRADRNKSEDQDHLRYRRYDDQELTGTPSDQMRSNPLLPGATDGPLDKGEND